MKNASADQYNNIKLNSDKNRISEIDVVLLREELGRSRDEISILKGRLAQNDEIFKTSKIEAREAQDIYNRVQAEISSAFLDVQNSFDTNPYYQVGKHIAEAFKQPLRLLILPFTLRSAIQRARTIRKSEKVLNLKLIQLRALSNIQAIIQRSVVLTLDQIATTQDRGLLRQSFWSALRANDFRRCNESILRLEELQAATPRRNEEKHIARMRSKLPDDIGLFKLAGNSQPNAIETFDKRICYFLHNSLPVSSGGYATRAHGLSKALHNAGFEVIAVTRPGFPLDNVQGLNPDEVAIEETKDGIVYRRILHPLRKGRKAVDYMIEAADAIEAMLREVRPTVVIAASNYYTGVPAMIAARRLNIPFIYEVRGFWEITRISREPEFINRRAFAIQEFMEAELCRQADAVFTLTRAMKGELVRRGVPIEKIELLPNACDPENFTPKRRSAALAKKLAIPRQVPVIGYIGSFVQYEGLENLAAACGILKGRGYEFRLLIVGNEDVSGGGMGPIASSIVKTAREGEFEDWLIMPGRVPHEEVPNYYSLVDIAPFPRKPQPVTEMVSPMKPLEAMAMEKAVLVSSVQAMAEMIIDGSTGLVFEKGSVVDMADKMQQLLEMSDLRHKLGQSARKWIADRRTWQRTGDIASRIVNEVTAKQKVR